MLWGAPANQTEGGKDTKACPPIGQLMRAVSVPSFTASLEALSACQLALAAVVSHFLSLSSLISGTLYKLLWENTDQLAGDQLLASIRSIN